MIFKNIHLVLIKYILDYSIFEYFKNPKLPPAVDTFVHMFSDRFSKKTIEDAVEELLVNGVLETHSFHSYLGINLSFKISKEFERVRKLINSKEKSKNELS